jgi:hypothetical protein
MSAYSPPWKQRVGEVPSRESVAVSPPSSPPAHVHSSVVVAHDDALALASGSDGVGTFSQAAVGSAPGETRRQTRAAEPDDGAATAPRALRLLDAGSEDGGASRPPAAATAAAATAGPSEAMRLAARAAGAVAREGGDGAAQAAAVVGELQRVLHPPDPLREDGYV